MLPESLDITSFYILIFLIVALCLLLIGLTGYYLNLIRKFIILQQENVQLKTSLANSQSSALSESVIKAQKIIDEAVVKASEVVSKSQYVVGNTQDLINRKVSDIQKEELKQFQSALNLTRDESIKILSNITKDINSILSISIKNFQESLISEVNKSQEEMKASLGEAYKKAHEEIELYKKTRLDEIEKSGVQIIKSFIQKVLTRKIDIREHEELVMKALEEAKKEGMFG